MSALARRLWWSWIYYRMHRGQVAFGKIWDFVREEL